MANTTWNPSDKSASITLSGGNLVAASSSSLTGARAIDRQVSGKFYWEVTANTWAFSSSAVGLAWQAWPLNVSITTAFTCGVNRNGTLLSDGVASGVAFGTIANASVICIAVDLVARLLWVRIGAAGNWNNNASFSPAAGTGGVSISLGAGVPAYPIVYFAGGSEQVTANFGDSAFTGAVPSGFTAGFTAGVSVPTNALATQAALEQWFAINPDAQVTQVAIEQWASVSSGSLLALVTQVALEEWTVVPRLVTGGQTLVSVNTG